MIRTLPEGSALAFEIHGEAARWESTNYQLATITDLLGMRFAGRRWRRVVRPVSKTKRKTQERPPMPVEEKRRRLRLLERRDSERRGKAVSDG